LPAAAPSGRAALAQWYQDAGLPAADTDGDGIPDAWERRTFSDPAVADARLDRDGDGLTDLKEFAFGSDPRTFSTMGAADFWLETRTDRPLDSPVPSVTAQPLRMTDGTVFLGGSGWHCLCGNDSGTWPDYAMIGCICDGGPRWDIGFSHSAVHTRNIFPCIGPDKSDRSLPPRIGGESLIPSIRISTMTRSTRCVQGHPASMGTRRCATKTSCFSHEGTKGAQRNRML